MRDRHNTKEKWLVLGYFGYLNEQLDGQTIKTRNIYNLFQSKFDNEVQIDYFDTQVIHHSFLNVLKMFWKVISSSKLLYVPAQNNLNFFFPFIYIICWFKRSDILYFVVGGWLTEYIKMKKLHVAFLSNVRAILTESNLLTEMLKNRFHFNNVITFPNFRIHSFSPSLTINRRNFRIVFMARINRMKGLDYIFHLAEYFNNISTLDKPVVIDLYGPVENEDKEYFYFNLNRYENISYKGVLQPEKIYETLNNYDLMIFPTRFYTEGFPGTILDSYIAGLPIVSTNWKFAADFIIHGKTGLIVPFKNSENEFINAVVKLYKDPDLLLKMKVNAYEQSKNYSAENAWDILVKNRLA